MTDTTYDYDLFVIGGGSGGVRAARIAAQAGARVALAEEYRMGGTCVVRGCVPKKFMVYASDYAKKIKQSAGYGWSVSGVSYDHSAFLKAMHAEVDRLSAIYDRNLKDAGAEKIKVIKGRRKNIIWLPMKFSGWKDSRKRAAGTPIFLRMMMSASFLTRASSSSVRPLSPPFSWSSMANACRRLLRSSSIFSIILLIRLNVRLL